MPTARELASSLASFQNIFQAGDDYFLPLQAHIPHSCSQPPIESGKYLGKERLESILYLDQGPPPPPRPPSVSVSCEYLIHAPSMCLTSSGVAWSQGNAAFPYNAGGPASDHGALGRRAACKSCMVPVSLETTQTQAHGALSQPHRRGKETV